MKKIILPLVGIMIASIMKTVAALRTVAAILRVMFIFLFIVAIVFYLQNFKFARSNTGCKMTEFHKWFSFDYYNLKLMWFSSKYNTTTKLSDFQAI